MLSPADDVYHIDKNQFDVPFLCGAKNLERALRRIAEGATMIRTKGRPGTGDVIQALRHMRTMEQTDPQNSSAYATARVYEAAGSWPCPTIWPNCSARQRPSARRELRRRWRGHPGRRRP